MPYGIVTIVTIQLRGLRKLVIRFHRNGTTMYLCELCGFGYQTIDTAEHCELHCDEDGFSSPKIRKKAVYEPRILVMPVAPRRQTPNLVTSDFGPKTLRSLTLA